MKQLFGLLTLIVLFASCDMRSPSQKNAEENTVQVIEDSNTSPVTIQELGRVNWYVVTSVKYEGKTYLVFDRSSGGVAVIEHIAAEQPTVNMDSVVANSVWLDEYKMLGYEQALPSKESIKTLTEPDVRPIPIGSEKEFIEYHNTSATAAFSSMVF